MKKTSIILFCLFFALYFVILGCSSTGSGDENEVPGTEAPVTEAPVAETPVAEIPVTPTPVTETPVAGTPVTETPVTPPPVAEVPVVEVPSSDASLASLSICGSASLAGSIDGEGKLEHAVDYSVTTATIAVIATSDKASVAIDKGTSFPIAVGRTEAIITVTAADGITVKRYTIGITRAKSPDATLSGLALSEGTLVPAFSPEKTAYTVAVAGSVKTITVTASATMTDATASISPIQPVTLPVGDTTITVSVTAPNGTDRKEYKVTVTRSAPYPATATLNSANGHHYLVVTPAMTWSAGKAKCEELLGHLATISNAAENDFVKALLAANGSDGLVGLNDIATEGSFVWVTGEPVTYTNWNSGEPNNSSNEDCAIMFYSSGKWCDTFTSLAFSAVCEWDE